MTSEFNIDVGYLQSNVGDTTFSKILIRNCF